MKVNVSGPLRLTSPRGGGFFFLCLSMLYGIVLALRGAGRLLGWRRSGTLKSEDGRLTLEQTTMFLGVPVQKQVHSLHPGAITAVSRGTDHDPGLLLVGAAALFYLSLSGVFLLVTGFAVAEPARIFWGLGLIVLGLAVDGILFSLHFILTRRLGEGVTISLSSGREVTLFVGEDLPGAYESLRELIR